MKNKRIAAFLCIAFVLTATSCGSSEAYSNQTTADTIDFNNEIDKENNSIPPQADNAQSQPDSTQPQPDNEQPQSDTELDGSIESIGDNSVVINKIFYPSENVAISYEDSDKVLITVYFSEEAEFEVRTVKNGGVNGDADIEKRQGAFSDLKKDASIHMTGSYEGEDFHAKQVIIYNFV